MYVRAFAFSTRDRRDGTTLIITWVTNQFRQLVVFICGSRTDKVFCHRHQADVLFLQQVLFGFRIEKGVQVQVVVNPVR